MNPTLLDFLAAAFILDAEDDGDYTHIYIGWAWPLAIGLLIAMAVLG